MEVLYSRKAQRDIRGLDLGTDRRRVLKGIRSGLVEETLNADIRAIGNGMLRLRVGDYRVLFVKSIDGEQAAAVIVRIVHRSELDQAVAQMNVST